jgi:hypothetical protein
VRKPSLRVALGDLELKGGDWGCGWTERSQHVRDQLADCVAREGRLAWACCSGPGLRYKARRRGSPGRNLSHCLCRAPAGWGGPSSRTRSWGRWCWASELQSAFFVRVLVGFAVVSEKPLILVLKAAP